MTAVGQELGAAGDTASQVLGAGGDTAGQALGAAASTASQALGAAAGTASQSLGAAAEVTGPEALLLVLALAGAGALGAVARVLVGAGVDFFAGRDGELSRGTQVVNASGAFAAGLLVGWLPDQLPGSMGFVLAVGFLGAFTTFSTWMLESWELLASQESRTRGVRYLVQSVVLGVLAALVGVVIGGAAT